MALMVFRFVAFDSKNLPKLLRNRKLSNFDVKPFPKHIVAPMVGHSDLPFRVMTRKYGADLVFTEMIHSAQFAKSAKYRTQHLVRNNDDGPLVIQFAGHDAAVILEAATQVEGGTFSFDLNLGCPQGIAKRGKYGAYLMTEKKLVGGIVKTLSSSLDTPITCKTRIFENMDETLDWCETLVNAGCSALTIHGRTKDEKGHDVKGANWEAIGRIKQHFGKDFPVVANGGIETLEDVQRCLDVTKADGVMSSESILENPAFFSGLEIRQLDLAEEFLRHCRAYPDPSGSKQSHLFKMLFRYMYVHRELLEVCGKAITIDQCEEVCRQCRKVVDQHSTSFDEDKIKYPISWYRRHRHKANTDTQDTSLPC